MVEDEGVVERWLGWLFDWSWRFEIFDFGCLGVKGKD